MTGTGGVIPLPADPDLRRTVAEWSVAAWAEHFPEDEVDTYLALYAEADGAGLPRVWVSLDTAGGVTGTASLVVDDDLPGAAESGPWLAAVWVHPDHRGRGAGRALVEAATEAARSLGHREMHLYTDGAEEWYERAGWRAVRTASLRGHPVTVMSFDLTTI